VPEDALSGERSVITLESSGRGNVVWSALLSGITKELPDPKTDSGQRIVRDYLQAPATHEGKPLPEGFGSIAGKIEQWQNRATAVALGAHIDVQVHYWNSRIEPDQSVVLEEPLPAGCLVRTRGHQRQLRSRGDGGGLLALLSRAGHAGDDDPLSAARLFAW
jgi:hypothetical protein